MDIGTAARQIRTPFKRSAVPLATAESWLLQRHVTGDPTAFAKLVRRYRAPVYSYLCRSGVAAPDRDDLFQEIFIKIHRSASRFDPTRRAHPWIFTIVANCVRNHLRQARVRALMAGELPTPEAADAQPNSERHVLARDRMRRLEVLIHRLPLVKREVLLLAAVQKLPLKEVARILGLRVNTVKTHLRRARQILARDLAAPPENEVSP